MIMLLQAGRKLVLDENMTDVNAIIKSHQEKVGEVITLKVMRFGGLTRTRQVIADLRFASTT